MRFNDLLVKFLIWRLKHISNNNFVLLLSGLIGLVAGMAAVTLKSTVHLIQGFLEKNLDITGINYLYLFYPLIGIMLTLIVAKYIFKEKLGHGITQILYTISKNSSIVRRSMMYSRMVTRAITVGFGGSVGLEAPIAHTPELQKKNVAHCVWCLRSHLCHFQLSHCRSDICYRSNIDRCYN